MKTSAVSRLIFLLICVITITFVCAAALSVYRKNDIDYQLARYLRATDAVGSARRAVSRLMDKQSPEAIRASALLSAPDEVVIKTLAPLLRSTVTLEEATHIADFYESETGTVVMAQYSARPNESDPELSLTKRQWNEYREFMQSELGAGAMRLIARLGSQDFWARAYSDLALSKAP